MFDVLNTEGDQPRVIEPAPCIHCHGTARWIDCPTGGWWAHDVHPADGHDAEV